MDTKFSSARFVKKYLTWIFLGLCLIILSIFFGVDNKVNNLIKHELQRQARSFFQEIVLTRKWIASHGGVYVKMTPDMEVNPYLLKVPGLKVLITDEKGDQYVLKNPALITREISELADQQGLFTFHITSLNPLNPNNTADSFEREALTRFDQGAKEYFLFDQQGQDILFQYMAPLITEQSCLRCHEFQGYKEGDIRGGIRVSIPATDIIRQMKNSRYGLLLSALGIILLVSGLIYYISRVFIKDLTLADERLLELASKDFLTGLLNRREAYNRLAREVARADRAEGTIGIMLLDIDHFKQVNDTHGHTAGDQVLKILANCLIGELRGYDILCRFGGEEFLVALQGASTQDTEAMAERLRKCIEQLEISLPDGRSLSVTVSIGVTERTQGENVDQVIDRADIALYRAKTAGRNRVEISSAEGSQN